MSYLQYGFTLWLCYLSESNVGSKVVASKDGILYLIFSQKMQMLLVLRFISLSERLLYRHWKQQVYGYHYVYGGKLVSYLLPCTISVTELKRLQNQNSMYFVDGKVIWQWKGDTEFFKDYVQKKSLVLLGLKVMMSISLSVTASAAAVIWSDSISSLRRYYSCSLPVVACIYHIILLGHSIRPR